MAKKRLPTNIPRVWLIWQYDFNWNWNDLNDWTKTNLTVTNATYWNSIFGYQKQNAVFWATTSATRASLAWIQTIVFTIIPTANTKNIFQYITTTSLISIDWSNNIVTTWLTNPTIYVNNKQSTLLTLNQINIVTITHDSKDATNFNFWVSSYLWQLWDVYFYNYKLSLLEIQNLYQEWLRSLWGWSDQILNSAVAYYDTNWDASDLIWWNNWTVTWASLTTDRFWISNRACFFDWNDRKIVFNNHLANKNNVSYFCWFKSWWNTWTNQSLLADRTIAWNLFYFYRVDGALVLNYWSDANSFSYSWTPWTTNRYHIWFTRNWSNASIYIDWVSVASWVASSYTNTTALAIWLPRSITETVWDLIWSISEPLFYDKTLTSDEVKELYNLSSKRYLYPFKKQLPLNLTNWLVSEWLWDNNWTTWYDNIWSNNWTWTAITMSRRWQHKVMWFNGTTSVITATWYTWTWNRTISLWVNISTLQNDKVIYSEWTNTNNNSWGIATLATTGVIKTFIYWWNENTSNIVTWVHHVVAVYDWTYIKLYIDWKFVSQVTAALNITATPINIWRWVWWAWNVNAQIWGVRNYNRALTPIEIQQLYYSTYIQ